MCDIHMFPVIVTCVRRLNTHGRHQSHMDGWFLHMELSHALDSWITIIGIVLVLTREMLGS